MTIKVRYSGKFVYYENSSDLNIALHLICGCGHELYEHAFVSDYGGMLTTSQCVVCGIVDNKFKCEKFTYNDSN